LAKPDEISSTEKLLGLIRDKSGKAPGRVESNPSSGGNARHAKNTAASGRLPRAKTVTVGVDIGEKDIKLVVVGPGPNRQPRLLKWAELPMDQGIVKDNARLSKFLKSAISGLRLGKGKVNVWGCISSANVETRALKIPRVAQKQVSNAVLWSFRKEASFNEKTDIFDYKVLGEMLDENIPRLQVMASTAPKHDVEGVRQLFSRCGYPLAGISIVPFALQNLFRAGWLKTNGEDVCALFIGTDWSRIAIFSEGNLVLSRDIKAGMKSMVDAISEGIEVIQEERSMQIIDMRDQIWDDSPEENHRLDADQAGQLLDEFTAAESEKRNETAPLTQDELFGMIQPAIDRIIRQVEMTFEHYYQHFSKRRVRQLYISGQISRHDQVCGYITEQLGLDVSAMDPFGSLTSAETGVSVPEADPFRGDFAPAAGLALSHNRHTPNFLYTYKDKARKRNIRRFDSVVLIGFALIMLIAGGAYQWLGHQGRVKNIGIQRLQKKLDQYSPRLDQHLVVKLAGQMTTQMRHLATVRDRYLGLSAINEVARITPEKVRLVNLTADFGPAVDGKKKGKHRHLVVDGVVTGDRLSFDAALADYIRELGNSTMFAGPTLEKRSMETLDDADVLRFAVRVKLI
jgi:type IV pilus assembly protein PilM